MSLGSVIGSFLIVMDIDGVPYIMKNITKLYADDAKILSKMNSDLYIRGYLMEPLNESKISY